MNITNPYDIEKRSFEIIRQELKGKHFEPINAPIIERVIHSSADFDFAENMYFSENAVLNTIRAIKNGATVITDTQMAFSGINKNLLKKYNCDIYCFMGDNDVACEAKKRGITRAAVSIEKASKIEGVKIFVIGNAPTALFKIDELYKKNIIKPACVLAMPVGFVNVVESKEIIVKSGVTTIAALGRKGGSSVAAAAFNAILILCENIDS